MGTILFPSHNDVANVAGGGRVLSEEQLHSLLAKMLVRSGMVSGLAPSNPSGATLRIASGTALINGCVAVTDANIDATIPNDSVTRYVYLKLTRDGYSRVTGVAAEVTTSYTPGSADSLLIASARVSGGVMVDWTDERAGAPGAHSGIYYGQGSPTPRTISTGRTPRLVLICSVSGTTNHIWAFSALEEPGKMLGPNLLTTQSRFYVKNAAAQTIYGRVLRGSVSYSKTFSLNEEATQNITVTGAAVGDGVVLAHDDADWKGANIEWRGRVASSNTVEAWMKSRVDGSLQLSGTLRAWVLDYADQTVERSDAVMLENTVGSTQCPTIVAGGFQVQEGTPPTLDESGRIYSYMAIY